MTKALTFVRNQLRLKLNNLKTNSVFDTALPIIQVFSGASGSIVFSEFFVYFSSGKKNIIKLLYNRNPQNLLKTVLFTFGFFFLIFYPYFSKGQQNQVFSADTKTHTFSLDSTLIIDFKLSTIYQLLGSPSRIESEEKKVAMEEFSHDKNEPPHNYWVQVTNYFYIYDDLGLVFYTRNGSYSTKDPMIMMVCYEFKREFDHDNFPDKIPNAYMPKKFFGGKLLINSTLLDPQNAQLPKEVNYKTEKIELFSTCFGATSRATIIDGLYSEKGFPYFRIYYNNGKEQKISYVQIML